MFRESQVGFVSFQLALPSVFSCSLQLTWCVITDVLELLNSNSRTKCRWATWRRYLDQSSWTWTRQV